MNITSTIHQGENIQLIKEEVPLADKNWFQTGGNARFFIEPTSTEEFQYALDFAKTHNLKIFVLGEGANILISDEGFDGLVIRPQLKTIKIKDLDNRQILLKTGAGVSMPELIKWCLEHNILGLEEFSGIPGTVGGSVFINLHYFEFLLSRFLISAEVICKETGNVTSVENDWFHFGYNDSSLHKHEYFLLNATFKLKKATDLETAYAKGRSSEIIRHRKKRYPYSGTCGSFFRNFHEDEVTLIQNNRKIIFIAYYLDKVGIKGILKKGNAQVSYLHANMIVNLGNAKTSHIIELAQTMQKMVYNDFKVLPQPECRLVGFKKYPLL